jgi:hypothetical protein
MHWKFDIDHRSLVRAFDDLSVKSAKLAFPDKYPIKVELLRGITAYVHTGTVRATVKATNRQQSAALAVMDIPVTASSVAEGVLNLSTTAMQSFVKGFGERPAVLELAVLDGTLQQIASWTVSCDVSRRYTDTGDVAIDIPDLKATKIEAEAGVNNTHWMTPLRVWEAIRAWAAVHLTWNAILNKPATFPPDPHIHVVKGDISQALQDAGITVL